MKDPMKILHAFLAIIFIFTSVTVSAQDTENKYPIHHKSLLFNDSDTYMADPRLLFYDVSFYYIDLKVNDTSTYITGFTEIYARSETDKLNELVFELSSGLTIDSVYLKGIKDTLYDHQHDLLIIKSNTNLSRNDLFSCRIYYHGEGGNDSFFSGISNRTDYQWNWSVTYTLSEPFHAKDWFVCKQVLNDKADSAYIFITVDTSLMAGSNGILANISPLSDSTRRFEWKTRYPVAFYLLSLSVSDYQDYSIYAFPDKDGDSLLIQNYIYDSSAFLDEHRENIDATRDLIELYSDLFTLYPFHREKYGHCYAPMGGGMEHQTMTTLSDFNFFLVAHELGHQWFGDNVTCATWQDIWINEGFASYIEYLAAENLLSKEDAQAWMVNAHDRARTEPEGSIYIPAEDAMYEGRIFSGALSYKKGAAILHMIRYELGDDSLFFQTLKNYQKIFSDSVATGLDFMNVLEVTSGKDFDWFFDQWYFGKGYPNFTMTWWQNQDTLIIASSQSGSSEQTPFFRTHIDFLIRFIDGTDTMIRVEQIYNDQYFKIQLPFFVSEVIADPDNWLLDVTTIIEKPPNEGSFSVGPNPFTDRLWIEFRNNNVKRDIIISDLNGKVIARYETESDLINLPLNNLVRGVYLFTVVEAGDSVTTKIVKD
jgi:aminopeptidase N